MRAGNAAASSISSTNRWYSLACSRFSPSACVCAAACSTSPARAQLAHSAVSANHGKAAVAATSPASSATRWLFADEPRLWKRRA